MRELFSMDPGVAHLNHGSFGAVPLRVQREQQRVRDLVEWNPMAFYDRDGEALVVDARDRLADFLGADREGCAFVANATSGTAIVLNTMALGEGDEVIVTDHLYNAVGVALDELRRQRGVIVTTVAIGLDATDAEIVAALVSAVRPGRTKLMIIDHIASATAKLFPITAIAAALAGSGVALHADAAHSPGMLSTPVTSLGADFWVGNLHKWGYAPRGTALLHVAPQWRDRVTPAVPSRGAVLGFPASAEQQGTRDVSGWIAAPAGTELLTELGAASRDRNVRLVAEGQRVVAEALGVTHLPDPGPEVSMRVVPLPPGTASTRADANELLGRIARELHTEVNIAAWNGTGLLRLCGQIYNTPDEYAALAAGLPKLL
ncbi:isopenicillin-N epimerase [Allocatelliglobosispora scoriae]|uniref:Isopenicillin-N epimerase n=1 Tax=Allocatelliglobosispora scoriae TaxID=643052 RepID=A0A841C001_9ACTN|nr:aminotransferase class V-fold PLP-dependent enzyme [Allocatelliglobosispora scoriae]MBB5872231.1 isopenicillin-N epimerase [Allocatelliglobosispora scoriae]